MNRVQFTGRLVDDLQRDITKGGTVVAKGRMAIDRAGQDGQSGFVNIESYGAGADAALRTVGKGWLIGLDGRLQHDQWEDKETGAKRQAFKFVGDIEFLARPQNAGNERQQEQAAGAGQEQTATAERGSGLDFSELADAAAKANENAQAAVAETEAKAKSGSRGRSSKTKSELSPAEAKPSTTGAKEPEAELAF